jgi:molecular chaperone IbpA
MKQLYVNSKLVGDLDMPSILRQAVGFDQIFNELHKNIGSTSNNYPPYNIIKKNDTTYSIEVAVAGFDEEELDVEIENGQLHVKGDASSRVETDGEYLHQGIALRNFDRTFTIAENVEIKGAVVKNGLLAIDMEHIIPESAKPKKIAITFQK